MGKPTYEILGKKRSIIDVALTNNINQIKDQKSKPHKSTGTDWLQSKHSGEPLYCPNPLHNLP